MSGALYLVWLATFGADRIDFLGGGGGVRITPFLVVTPVLLAAEVLRLHRQGGTLRVPRAAPLYALLTTLFLALALLSVFFSFDLAISARRFTLLLIQVYGVFAATLLLHQRPDASRILVGGAYAGLALGLLFNVLQLIAWFTVGPATGDGSNLEGFVFLQPWPYGPWIPRLSGQVVDMNRGGFLFLVYLFLLLRFARPSRLRASFVGLAVVMILLTLSRSVLLALLVTGLLLGLQKRSLRVTPRTLLAPSVVVAGVCAALLVFPGLARSTLEFVLPLLALRFLGDGSSNIHFDLLVYGLEVGSASVKNALLGIGFGNSFAVLEAFFPGNKYGNFHSLYVTLLVETGVVALAIGMVLLLLPFARSAWYRPLVAGLLAFSVFYQSLLEPTFWFVLTAAWLELATATPAAEEPGPVLAHDLSAAA